MFSIRMKKQGQEPLLGFLKSYYFSPACPHFIMNRIGSLVSNDLDGHMAVGYNNNHDKDKENYNERT